MEHPLWRPDLEPRSRTFSTPENYQVLPNQSTIPSRNYIKKYAEFTCLVRLLGHWWCKRPKSTEYTTWRLGFCHQVLFAGHALIFYIMITDMTQKTSDDNSTLPKAKFRGFPGALSRNPGTPCLVVSMTVKSSGASRSSIWALKSLIFGDFASW